VLEVAQEQHVDVDRARPVARSRDHPAELALDHLAGVEQLLGAELGLDLRDRVQEVGLVEDLALWLGLVERRAAGDADAVVVQQLTGALDLAAAVPDVRAEPEVALQEPSFQTSTATSSTGSSIGGSGLATRTVTDSAP
jgi:hypothetical protein